MKKIKKISVSLFKLPFKTWVLGNGKTFIRSTNKTLLTKFLKTQKSKKVFFAKEPLLNYKKNKELRK